MKPTNVPTRTPTGPASEPVTPRIWAIDVSAKIESAADPKEPKTASTGVVGVTMSDASCCPKNPANPDAAMLPILLIVAAAFTAPVAALFTTIPENSDAPLTALVRT
jgi:hypothetical protein